MNKKTIMLGIYIINLIMFLVYSMLSFSMYTINMVENGKANINVKWTQKLENDAYIDMIYDVSDQIAADVMIRTLNDDMQFQYYRTESDPSFIDLKELKPDLQYSTNPENGEQKIHGFFFLTDSHFRIAPLRSLKGKEIDLSIQQFLVPTDKADAFATEMTTHGFDVSTERGVSVESDFSSLYIAIVALAFFLIVSVVFYAFSRSKDIFVKKTMGFDNWDIVKVEMKKNGLTIILISLIILALAFLLFSVLSDISSTLLFLQKSILKICLYLFFTFLLIIVFIYFVSTQCSISHSKGKSFNKQLFAFTVVFKTVLIIFLGIAMADLFGTVSKVYTMYRATQKTADLVEGYAETELNTLLESPMQLPEKYAPILHSFYQKMHDAHNLIIISRQNLLQELELDAPSDRLYQITINDNYLDAFQTIYDTNGKPLDSTSLQNGKLNYLVPENYDVSKLTKKLLSKDKYTEDDLNFIRYSESSQFFLFTNKAKSGFIGDSKIIAEVFDEKQCYQTESEMTYTAFLSSYVSNSMFYTYNTNNDQDPFYQILPLLKENGMDKIVISSPSVYRQFLSDVEDYRYSMIYSLIQFLVLLFSFIVMIFYATELHFKVYAKDISIKIMNGYSFGDIFMVRMLMKLMVFPVLVLFAKVRLLIAVCCILLEMAIFFICMKKNLKMNMVAILKGE